MIISELLSVDFGLEVLENFMSKCTFPWLLSNVFDRCTGRPLADAHETYLVDWEGVKVCHVPYESPKFRQSHLATTPNCTNPKPIS